MDQQKMSEIRSLIQEIRDHLQTDDDTEKVFLTRCRQMLKELTGGENVEFGSGLPDTDSIIADLQLVEEKGVWRPRLLPDVQYTLLEFLDKAKAQQAAARYFGDE